MVFHGPGDLRQEELPVRPPASGRARVESGQTVVVFGHGPLGCLLGMLAASRKARVVMVGKSGWRFDRLKQLGFARWLDAATAGDVIEDIRGATGGRGADVAV